jgi:hypothetical protein
MFDCISQGLLAMLSKLSLIFPGTYHAWRRIVPLKRDVINCKRNAMPRTLEVLVSVFILYLLCYVYHTRYNGGLFTRIHYLHQAELMKTVACWFLRA